MLQSGTYTLHEDPNAVADCPPRFRYRTARRKSTLQLASPLSANSTVQPLNTSALGSGTLCSSSTPASERFPATTSRVGFAVASIDAVLDNWRQSGCEVLSELKESPYGLRAVVVDPDGHRVELTTETRIKWCAVEAVGSLL